MRNKYLEKIAAKKEDELFSTNKELAVGGATALGGAIFASDQYHRGHLTGRETLYHGSSIDRLEKIKKEGLKPNQTGGIGEAAGLTSHNENLVFMEKRKGMAKAYGAVQEGLDSGTLKFKDMDLREKITAKAQIPGTYRKNIIRIDLPTWKQEFTPRMNPEYRKTLRDPDVIKAQKQFMQDSTKKELKETLFENLQRQVHVNRGPNGISPEFIRGSSSYKGNSLNEIGQYIKANPKRFAKGVGKATAGLGIIGAGAAILAHAKKRMDEK